MDLGYYVGCRLKEEMKHRELNSKYFANLIYERLGFKSSISAMDYIRSVREGYFNIGPFTTKNKMLKRLSGILAFFNITKNDEIILKIKREYPEFKYNLNNNHSEEN